MEEGNFELRKYPRMKIQHFLTYRPVSSPKEETVYTETKTLGLGGLMFESPKPFDVNTDLHLNLVIDERSMEIKAYVVYTSRLGDDLFEIGVEYSEIREDDQDFLMGYYMRKQYSIDPGKD